MRRGIDMESSQGGLSDCPEKWRSVQHIASRLGYELVTGMNPPLHGVTVGWRGHGTTLSDHGEYLLFHYHGGNRTIRTERQLRRVTKFLDYSWRYNE